MVGRRHGGNGEERRGTRGEHTVVRSRTVPDELLRRSVGLGDRSVLIIGPGNHADEPVVNEPKSVPSTPGRWGRTVSFARATVDFRHRAVR